MLVHAVEDLTALLRHKHQVLHPDPKLTREVHSWLNGEDHPRLGYQLCDCTYIPLLMLCLANKMPQAVGEVLTIARRSDMFPGRDVQLPQGDAPGRIIPSAISLALRTRSWMAAYLGSAVLQKKVRVISEQYRSFRQPISMTMQSPAFRRVWSAS